MADSAADHAIIDLDRDGTIVGWNAGAAATFGYGEAEALGRHHRLIWTVEERADGSPEHELTMARVRGAAQIDRWHVRADRRRVHVIGATRPVRNGAGELAGFVRVCRDDTEQRDADVALARAAAIIESSDDAIVSKSLDGVIRTWNPAAERLFGYTAFEAIGRSITMLLPPDRADEEPRILAQLRAGGRVDHFETVRLARDGTPIDVSVTISPIRDGTGRVVGASKIARDIGERKRARAEAERSLAAEREARVQAELAGRAKDEFLATLSHELRTPLNAVVGWTQILKGSRDEEDLTEGLAVIERNARAQTQIIEDILDMSRIVSGKLRLDVQRVDLAALIRSGIGTVQPAADAKGVAVDVVLDPAAGPVAGDPNRLHQVLWNLLSNAVKFTPRGGRVQVLLERVNSHVEVSVIDTGEGIDPAFLPHVFDRFRQADASTSRRHGGLGLGLAIVKQLVELHGGSVRAKSPGPGAGTTLVVALPLTAVADPGDVEAPREHPGAELPAVARVLACDQLKGVSVVAVDDEPDGRAVIARLLEGCGAVVRTAGSAAEALDLIRADPPSVLVSDIGMPGEDGYNLIARVRSLPPDQGGRTHAVALTAYARSADRVRALEAGFQMHLSKPVDATELIVTVASLARLAGASGNRSLAACVANGG